MVVIPYVLFSDQDITQVKDLIDFRVHGWCESVFGESATNVSSLRPANLTGNQFNDSWAQAELDVQFEVRIGTKSTLIKLTADSNQWLVGLGVLPFSDSRDQKKPAIRNDEANILLHAVAQDLSDAISALNINASTSLSESDLLHYSALKGAGILFYSINLHGLLVEILMDGRHLKISKGNNEANVLINRRKIDSRLSACAELSTHVNAFLGTVEISIGDLSKINLGDVIRLDASISDLVSLGTSAKQVICNGNLGASDGHKALRIVS